MIDKIDLTKLYDISSEIAEIYRNNIHNSGVTASGELENFTWEIDFDGNTYKLIYNLPAHWKWVENSRKPTSGRKTPWTDPVKDIVRWMELKHIVPRPAYTKSLKPSRAKIPTKEETAYMIVRKIHKFGYYGYNQQGKHLLEKSMDEAELLIMNLTYTIAETLFDTTILPDINAIDK
jgi:hypothetical protein